VLRSDTDWPDPDVRGAGSRRVARRVRRKLGAALGAAGTERSDRVRRHERRAATQRAR